MAGENSFMKDLEELCADEDPALRTEEEEEEDINIVEGGLKYDDDLQNRFNDIMGRVEDAKGVILEELIAECNSLLVDMEKEMVIIHNCIRDKYSSKFPELESLVHHPTDYARLVKKIGNETDLTRVDLRWLLPSSVIVSVSITASSSSGKPLPEQVLQKAIEACDRALALEAAKEKILQFIESRMRCIAPNLSAVVGSGVAAKLVGSVGGLSTLANIPACNVQILGAKRKTATSLMLFRVGYLEETEIFQATPPSLRMRACRLLAAKSVLASRVDCMRADPTGKVGASLRGEILRKIEKWQEAPPAKRPKPLPVPADSEAKKKKRGGRRLRKMKERYGMTETRKLANRMAFGVGAEESSLGDGLGHGFGMLGKLMRRRLPVGGAASSVQKQPTTSSKISHRMDMDMDMDMVVLLRV